MGTKEKTPTNPFELRYESAVRAHSLYHAAEKRLTLPLLAGQSLNFAACLVFRCMDGAEDAKFRKGSKEGMGEEPKLKGRSRDGPAAQVIEKELLISLRKHPCSCEQCLMVVMAWLPMIVKGCRLALDSLQLPKAKTSTWQSRNPECDRQMWRCSGTT